MFRRLCNWFPTSRGIPVHLNRVPVVQPLPHKSYLVKQKFALAAKPSSFSFGADADPVKSFAIMFSLAVAFLYFASRSEKLQIRN
jgi:hypothetical protein